MTGLEQRLKEHFSMIADLHEQDGLRLAQYVAGDLDSDDAVLIETHIGDCTVCQAWLADDSAMAAVFTDALQPAPSWRRKLWEGRRLWAGLAVAASVAFVLLTVNLKTLPQPEKRFTAKGNHALHVAFRQDDRTARYRSKVPLDTGDGIGLFYSASEQMHLGVMYVSHEGEVVMMFPHDGDSTRLVSPGRELALSDGAILTESTGCEWIVGVFASEAIPKARLVAAVRRMHRERRGCSLAPYRAPDFAAQVIDIARKRP